MSPGQHPFKVTTRDGRPANLTAESLSLHFQMLLGQFRRNSSIGFRESFENYVGGSLSVTTHRALSAQGFRYTRGINPAGKRAYFVVPSFFTETQSDL
jgi:hypothetical protein